MRRALPILILLAAGCAGTGPPPLPAPPDPLTRAETLWRGGDAAGAAAIYRQILEDEAAPGRDEALYRLALIELAAAPPGAASSAGLARLRRLVAEYPESPNAPAARLLLDLASEVERLREQLERLKRIDLGRDGR